MSLISKKAKVEYLALKDTHSFSKLVEDYVTETVKLGSFYRYAPSDKGLLKAIDERKNFPVDRTGLLQVIQKQYEGLSICDTVQTNIDLLKRTTTFTVCTAHQPNLMTGYLYFFYKIIHAVKLAQHLKQLSPSHDFVPVFYIGSEDNDIEELGVFRFEGKTYRWNTRQKGAVGSMLTSELAPLIEELRRHLGPAGEELDKLNAVIDHAYLQGKTIAEATRIIINAFLGHLGVVVLDANEAHLKSGFSSVIEQELFDPKAYGLVSESSKVLNDHWKVQAFARPINLFYLKEQIRNRIEKQGEHWKVVDTDIRFSSTELLTEVQTHPERFSPNVILRGLYQESILPNVAFIGGGSEVTYWMQLKRLFHHYGIFFPAIILRQSVQVFDGHTDALRQKLGLEVKALFLPEEELVQAQLGQVDDLSEKLQMRISEFEELKSVFLSDLVQSDQQMKNSTEAAFAKMDHQWKVLEKKVMRATKRKHSDLVKQLNTLKAHVFPEKRLQERILNFMELYLKYGAALFDDLLEHTKPFGDEFLVLRYEN